MSLQRLPPTRLNLLRAGQRLARVQKGAGLLRRKREALVAELFRLARPAADARQQIERTAHQGYELLLNALALRGLTGIRPAAWPARELRVEVESAPVWGTPIARIVSHPPLIRTVAARGLDPAGAGPATHQTAEVFERLADLLLDAATRELLLRRLGEELSRTSRQVHTLERRVTPSLLAQMETVRRVLEEREREEHLRLKRLSHQHAASGAGDSAR